MVAVDPEYGNRILRVTDGNTGAGSGASFNTGASAEKNATSYDESMFLVHTAGSNLCLFSFDQANFASTFRGCFNNLGNGSGAEFGYTADDNHAIYNYAQAKLYRFVVNTSDWSVAPDSSFNGGQGFFDPDGPQCLGGQIAANKWTVHGHAMSSDDQTLIAAIGRAQDVDQYYVVWNASKGCQWMDVQKWEVSSGWNSGPKSGVPISWVGGLKPTGPGGIHNAQIDRGGKFGVLTIHNTGLDRKMFWRVGTTSVDATCKECVSHWACDYGVCFWNHQTWGSFGMVDRAIGSDLMTPNMNLEIFKTRATGNEEHASHANAEPGMKLPYLVSWDNRNPEISAPWENEIMGVSWDGSQKTIRFNKSWTSGLSFWSTARCSISRQGHYALCGSDYQLYNLDHGFGNGLNQDTCDRTLPSAVKGTKGCRTDVLLFELR